MQVRRTKATAAARLLAVAATVMLLAAACGGDDSESTSTGSNEAPLVSLNGTVNNHGNKDLGSATKLEVELDDLYFAPTFVKAKPGSEVEISLKNEGETQHTFTIDETKTNVEVAPGKSGNVKVKLPASGALAFYCSFHRASGMQGAFSVSEAAATPANPAPNTTAASSSGGYGY
jgi:plastocyanin